MIRNIIIAAIALVLTGAMVMRLASNKSKIDKETSYREVVEHVSVHTRTIGTAIRISQIELTGLFKPSQEAPVSTEIPGRIATVSMVDTLDSTLRKAGVPGSST